MGPLSGLVNPTLKQEPSQSFFVPWSTVRMDAHSFRSFTICKIDSITEADVHPIVVEQDDPHLK